MHMSVPLEARRGCQVPEDWNPRQLWGALGTS